MVTTPAPKAIPLWKLLSGIIDQPARTFQAILAQYSWRMWAVPLLIVLLAFVALTVIGAPYGLEFARRQIEQQLATMPPGDAEAARPQMERFVTLPTILIAGLGFGGLGVIAGIVAQATVLYFTALVAGGDMKFSALFTMSAWSRLPLAVGFLAQAGYIAVARRIVRYPGLAALVASGNLIEDSRNPLFLLLGRIDLFWLWHLLLVVVGLAVVARFSRFKALVLTLIYAALWLVTMVIPALLQTALGGGG
ncbi:MAG: YIP1 family protein [Anaerolineae bacterium]